MRIVVKTFIPLPYKQVFESFDRPLLEYLSPKSQLKIVNITGTGAHIGDVVELLILKPCKAQWVSKIIAREIEESEAYFLDQGVVLPFGLTSWTHKHIVKKVDEQSCEIIDQISFKTRFWIQGIALYLPFWLSFYTRKKKYRRYFNKG